MEEPKPLDVDGIAFVTTGLAVWVAALLVLIPFHSRLRHDGHLWWYGVCATGVALGLLGLRSCRRRAAALARLRDANRS